jgi:hypothetical protein
MLVKYIRDWNHHAPVGTIVAVKSGDEVKVGWAWASKKDQPNKKIGKEIALSRLDAPEKVLVDLYHMYQERKVNSKHLLPHYRPNSIPMILIDEICLLVKRLNAMEAV